jgi:hypothetical protein
VPRGQTLQKSTERSTVHDAGALDVNHAAPTSPIALPARTAAPRLDPRKPHHPLQPSAQQPQPTACSIIHAQPAFAATRSQHSCAADARSVPPRPRYVSCAILPRLGASDAVPSSPIALSAYTAAPRNAARKPHQAPPPAAAPHATASAHSIIHAQPASQAPAHSAAAAHARSVPERFSVVSCVILPRLGASDAAPAAPIPLPARIAAPRSAPPKPHHSLQPHTQPPQPATRNIISTLSAFASTRSQRSCRACTQRTPEVQRRQLHHQ